MTTHSSILAWENPWTEEPDELQSRGPKRFGHNLATKQQLCIARYVEGRIYTKIVAMYSDTQFPLYIFSKCSTICVYTHKLIYMHIYICVSIYLYLISLYI